MVVRLNQDIPNTPWWSRLWSFATRGIPDLSAEALGFFRVFYATFLFIALHRRRLDIHEAFVAGARSFDWAWVRWLIDRPDLVARLEDGILVLLVMFAVGLFTRVSYALIAAGLTIWIVVMLQQDTNIHVWEVAFLTVLCLIPVPWGAALSVDAMVRRRRGDRRAEGLHGKRFGFAVWIPGFILGAVWLGAAIYKLQDSGLTWILGGAVKYHWVMDAVDAPVDWGLWVATHHWVAVLMSAFGIALEATFIIAAFVRSSLARTLLAVAIGVPLLGGFYLFHGVAWWTWWLVLLCFAIPWQEFFNVVSSVVRRQGTIDGDAQPYAIAESKAPTPLRATQGVVICVVCVLMIDELPEGIGRFTSYSNTYASTDEFDRRNPLKPVDRLWIRYGTPNAVEVLRRLIDAAGEEDARNRDIVLQSIDRLSQGKPLSPSATTTLRALGERLVSAYGDQRLTLVREKNSFDWQAGQFVSGERDVLGTLDLGFLTFIADENR